MILRRKKTQKPRPLAPVDYPSDVFVATEKGVYFIKGAYKFRLFSEKALDSWGAKIIQGSEAALANHKEGPVLGFRNGTMIKTFSDACTYLVSGNKRRKILDFERYGLDDSGVIIVSRDEINIHEEGEVLS